MAASLTVPPAVRLAFAKYAFQVCLEAEVDDLEFEGKHREICNHLEQEWEQGAKTKSTEAAKEDALQQYGSVEQASQLLKKSFGERFIFHHRYRTERFLVVLVFILFQLVDDADGRWNGYRIELSIQNLGFYLLTVVPLVFIYCWRRRDISPTLRDTTLTPIKSQDNNLSKHSQNLFFPSPDNSQRSAWETWMKRSAGLVVLMSSMLFCYGQVNNRLMYLCNMVPLLWPDIMVLTVYLWLQGVLLGIAAVCFVRDAGLLNLDLFRRWMLRMAR